MKQIPNLFTLLNLFFGCIAIVFIVQSGLMPVVNDETGMQYILIPEKIWLGSLFIGLAAVVDFFDGFVARLLKATSEMGKQLDSLADVVSFGVAPGMILFQFLRLSYAQQEDGLDINIIWVLPAFIFSCAAAYRLAKFNIDASQSNSFKGVPSPAAGLLIASFPLIWFDGIPWAANLLINTWFLYGVILLVSYLMVSNLPMMALKFSKPITKKLMPFILLAVIAITTAFFLNWIAVPATFLAYVILSLLNKQKSS